MAKNEDIEFSEEEYKDFDDESTDTGSDSLLEDDNMFDEFGSDSDLGIGMQTPLDKHSDLLKTLTDFEPYLKVLISEWLGMRWSPDEEKYIKDNLVEPIMNIQGARWCINYLRTYTRDNNIITRLDETTYKELMEDIIDVAIMNIGTRAEEFGIKKDGDCLVVWTQLIHAAQLVLIGAGGHKTYSDLLSSSTQRTENVNYNPNQSGQMVGFSDNNNNIQMNKPKKKTGFMQYLKNTMK